MTFIEAAIEILHQAGRPLHVHELTERALKQRLLSHQGRAPEATMQTRLAQEVKKGDRTPLVQKGQGTFGLKSYERAKPAPAGKAASKSRSAEVPAVDAERKRGRRRRTRKEKDKAQPEAGTPEEALAAEALDSIAETAPETATPTATATDAATATDTATDTATATPSDTVTAPAPASEPPIVDLDALQPVSPRRYPRIVDLPPEEALAAEYADEIAGGSVGPPAAEEVVDAQSADEDRPLLAEIKEEREHRGRNRRRERRGKEKGDKKEVRQQQPAQQPAQQHERRQEHGRHDRHEKRDRGGHQQPHQHAAPRATEAPAQTPAPHPQPPSQPQSHPQTQPQNQPQSQPQPQPQPPSSTAAVAGSVADIAVSLLRSLNDPRPVHARQLAAMALKRKLLAGDPEELWRAIRAALLADARERHSAGMRPRARAQGGGLFALATGRLDDAVRGAEEALAARLDDLARATRDGLRAALTRLPMGAIEQVARLYLERAELREIERVKRTGEATYLGGTRRDGKKILIGVRTGGGEVGRHSVGELRAGVEAKACAEGMLLAAGRLGTEGARELGAAGPRIVALVGDDLADALIRAGIAVQRAAIPVAYLDIDLLAELGE